MKKVSLLLVLAFGIISFSLNAQSQLTNINPDPNGEPWWVGNLLIPEEEDMEWITPLVLSEASISKDLPDFEDNSEEIWFPPVFNQLDDHSCASASEISYSFTYEINRIRNVAAGGSWIEANNDYENLYYRYYTYNFLNNGSGTTDTYLTHASHLVMQNGCPDLGTYWDPALLGPDKFKYWMTGHDKYVAGMQQKISEYHEIHFNVNYESLETLKHWIADHGNGEETGGLAVIAIRQTGYGQATLPEESPHFPDLYLTNWGTSGGHAITIVGYDEDVLCDSNGDGIYNITEDINGDGYVNLKDREVGAFKIVNSFGTSFGNEGFIWVPYRLMAEGLLHPNKAYVASAMEYEPELTIKATIQHPYRDKFTKP
jgi:hypothetical protein